MRELTSFEEIIQRAQEAQKSVTSITVVIDGKTLTTILNSEEAKNAFFNMAIKAPCVCVCRCSPQQKSDVVKALKHYTNGKRIAAIGDGGNDVGMIMESDVGIGIEGKEGLQAALASDFSIQEFSYLKRLVLWHGR